MTRGSIIPPRFRKDHRIGRVEHNRFKVVVGLKKAAALSRMKKGNRPVGVGSQFSDFGVGGRKLKRGRFAVTWRA